MRQAVAISWAVGLATLAAVRLRTGWEPYIEIHRWLAARGIPSAVRNLDALLIYVGGALLGAWLVGRMVKHPPLVLLRARLGETLDGPARLSGGWVMALVAIAPMVLGGVILGLSRDLVSTPWRTAVSEFTSSCVRAPLGEEFLFRGLLVAVPACALGWAGRAFRINLVAAGLLFGLTHIAWSWAGLTSGWPALLVTAIGGGWYGWLLARWQLLWVPIVLHAGMNLGWLLSGSAGGAGGGGLIENLLRAATIAMATVWTIRATRAARARTDTA
jgi:membrane protease YdiL (CAAX protease family)